MDYESELAAHLERLGLPQAARDWLIDLWRVIQFLDDAADGDDVPLSRVMDVTWAILIRIPANPFWDERKAVLMPVIATQILKWEASDAAERAGDADERSYMWRAGFYDVVMIVCHLCGVKGVGREVMGLYGETFADYRGEFPCQTPQ